MKRHEWMLLLGIGLSACGGSQDNANLNSSEFAESSAASVDFLSADGEQKCSEDLLTFAKVTDGTKDYAWATGQMPTDAKCVRWKYQRDKICRQRVKECGTTCTKFKSCQSFNHGVTTELRSETMTEVFPDISSQAGNERIWRRMFADGNAYCARAQSMLLAKVCENTTFCRARPDCLASNVDCYLRGDSNYDGRAGDHFQTKYTCSIRVNVEIGRWAESSLCGCVDDNPTQYRRCKVPSAALCDGVEELLSDAPQGGLTLDSARAAAYAIAPAHEANKDLVPFEKWIKNFGCLTADDISIAELDRKASTLITNAQQLSDEQLRVANYGRLLALLEYYGDRLSKDFPQRFQQVVKTAVDLYPSLGQGKAMTCGLPLNQDKDGLSASCASALPAGYLGRANLCKRLLAAHVQTGPMDALLDTCFQSAGLLRSMPAGDCATQAKQYQAKLENSLLDKWYEKNLDPDFNSMDRMIPVLERWLTSTNTNLSDQTELQKRIEKVLELFWLKIHGRVNPLFKSTVTPSEETGYAAVLDGAAAKGAMATNKVITAVFKLLPDGSYGSARQGLMLAYLLSDAVRFLGEQLSSASELHDFACLYLNCLKVEGGKRVPLATPVYASWKLLASLTDKDALKQALDNPKLPMALKVSFTNISSRLNSFFQLVGHLENLSKAEDVQALLLASPVASPFSGLTQMLKTAKTRVANYEQNGLLLGTSAKMLHVGMQKGSQAEIVKQLDPRVEGLNRALAEYRNGQSATLNRVLEELRTKERLDTVEQDVTHRLFLIGNLVDEENNLRKQINQLEQSFGQYSTSFAKIASNLDENNRVKSRKLKLVTLTGKDARFSCNPDSATDCISKRMLSNTVAWVPAMSLPEAALDSTDETKTVWKMSLKVGERLDFNVDGVWSPSCSIQKSKGSLRDSASQSTENITISQSNVGPEGYSLVFLDQDAMAVSATASNESYNRVGRTKQNCDSTSTGFGGSLSLNPISIQLPSSTSSASVCDVRDRGTNNATSNTSSQTQSLSYSSQFNAGLLLSTNPFPDSPSGALLAVAVAPGADIQGLFTGAVEKSMVVQRQSTLFADKDYDVYLVVNDLSGCASSGSQSAIQIDLMHSVPEGVQVQKLSSVFVQAIDDLRKNPMVRPEDEVPGRRAAILLKLKEADLALSPDVQAFFEAWLDKELSVLSLSARIVRTEREIDVLYSEMRSYLISIESLKQQSHQLTLYPMRSLENFMAYLAKQELSDFVGYATRSLYPVLKLRYRGGLENFVSSARTELDALLQTDLSDTMTSKIEKLVKVAERLRKQVDDVSNYGNVRPDSQPEQPVIVLFPQPELVATYAKELVGMNVASNAALQSVWDAIHSKDTRPVTFDIKPQHVYKRAGDSILLCDQVAPVVQSMALFLVTDDDITKFVESNKSTSVRFAESMSFPDDLGENLGYQVSPVWNLDVSVRVLATNNFGSWNSAIFANMKNSAGSGASPFTSFTLTDYLPFKEDFQQAKAIGLAFLLDYRKTQGINNPGLWWLDSCK